MTGSFLEDKAGSHIQNTFRVTTNFYIQMLPSNKKQTDIPRIIMPQASVVRRNTSDNRCLSAGPLPPHINI